MCEVFGASGACGADGVCVPFTCGDGALTQPERCDGALLGGLTCLDFDYYVADGLRCAESCTVDLSGCQQRCGDGEINGDEDCDGAALGGTNCQSLGFYDEAGLGCSSFCRFDVSTCTGRCGDGVVNGFESCDGGPPVTNCVSNGFSAGHAGCTGLCAPELTPCRIIGWQSQAVASGTLFDLWESPAGDVIVVGAAGRILRMRGWGVASELSGTNRDLRAVSGSAADHVFAVGADGTIVRYDGQSWAPMASGTTTGLTDVHVFDTTSAIAVGNNGTVVLYDGAAWTVQASGLTTHLHAVWGSAPDDVYAVGQFGGLFHFDGATWSTIPSGTTQNLDAVWGTSSTDVYVGGTTGTLLHLSGSQWITETIPGGRSISSVFVRPNSLAIATSAGTVMRRSTAGEWTVIGSTTTIYEILELSTGDYVMVGAAGTIGRFQRATWSFTSAFTEPFATIWPRLDDEVHVSVAAPGFSSDLYVWDGAFLSSTLLYEDVHGIVGINSTLAFGAGQAGKIYSYTNGSWGLANQLSTTAALRAISGTSATNLMVVGDGGVAFVKDASGWRATATGSTEHLRSVWLGADGIAVAVGDAGTALRWDGSQWSAITTGVTTRLNGVWGASSDDVHAVGEGGVALRWNGTSWTRLATHLTLPLKAVWGSGPTDVFAVGVLATILHFDGQTWAPVLPPSGDTYTAVAGRGTQRLYLADDAGGIAILTREVPW